MIINSGTKIAALIRHNKAAVEAIAGVNPHFNKLRNPVLRRVLAPRVSIGDAARIGNCRIEDLFSALSSIGFEIEKGTTTEDVPISDMDHYQAIRDCVKSGKVKRLDVRPALQRGQDPFTEIMESLKTLPASDALEVVNTFEPTPLIRLLSKKGYSWLVESDDEAVITYFLKTREQTPAPKAGEYVAQRLSAEALEALHSRFGKLVREIDVRDLEMPLPMVTILSNLDDLKEGEALYVHHKKVPQFLLPELEERHFSTWIAEINEGNVKMLIHR